MEELKRAQSLLHQQKYAEAAQLMLEAHAIFSAQVMGDETGKQELLSGLRGEIARVLGKAELFGGFVSIEEDDLDGEEDLEVVAGGVVGDDCAVDRRYGSPMEMYIALHPRAVVAVAWAPRPQQEPAALDETSFTLVDAGPPDWVLLDEPQDEEDGRLALKSSKKNNKFQCLECGILIPSSSSSKGVDVPHQRPGATHVQKGSSLPDCRVCHRRYCLTHAYMMEQNGCCMGCSIDEEQSFGASRSHSAKFLFCRDVFVRRSQTRIQHVLTVLPKCVVDASASTITAKMTIQQMVSAVVAKKRLCAVCLNPVGTPVQCSLCSEHCCKACLSASFPLANAGAYGIVENSQHLVIPQCCKGCSSLLKRHNICLRLRQGLSERQRDLVEFYAGLHQDLSAATEEMQKLQDSFSLCKMSGFSSPHEERKCWDHSKELDRLFTRLSKGALWLKDHRTHHRVVLSLSAFVAEFYTENSAILRNIQGALKKKNADDADNDSL